ncbi:hypothetical protein D3C80_832790 [compost metagenome]
MKERPILFSGPMVRAILSGQKTVTRRAMKHQPCRKPVMVPNGGANFWSNPLYIQGAMMGSQNHSCPYGQPGDRLWVREAWAQINVAQAPGESWVVYRECDNRTDYGGPWRPSIHMRRRDSRILLEVTDVRVERLQDISEGQVLDEGIGDHRFDCDRPVEPDGYPACSCGSIGYVDAFAELWNTINGTGAWDTNPWVWVVEFKRIEP